MNIVGNCGLCDQHSLHIMGEGETETQQCINCGYVTSARYKLNGTKREEHELFKNLTEEMQNWSVVHNDSIWIPTVMTLPLGMLYPINIYNTVSHETELKWAFAKMVDIPQQEQKNYPDGKVGFYEKRIDTDNAKIYDVFVEGMHELNQKMKEQNKPKQSDVKLPKLKKIDGEK